jgi:hypothetical protein
MYHVSLNFVNAALYMGFFNAIYVAIYIKY